MSKITTEAKSSSNGGISFYITTILLFLILVNNVKYFPKLLEQSSASSLFYLAIGIALGMLVGYIVIHGHTKAFIHELKHLIVAILAGNRVKDFHFRNNAGHLKYQFTETTKKFNALIALAPYFLPLFTIPTLILMGFLWNLEHNYQIILLAMAFGFDFFANIRDISPAQTDISTIRGGYFVGLVFIIVINFVLFSLLLTWCLQGISGLFGLLYFAWSNLISLVFQS